MTFVFSPISHTLFYVSSLIYFESYLYRIQSSVKDIFDNFESIKEIFNNEEDKQFLKLKDIIIEYNKLSENKKSDNIFILEVVAINKIDEITYNAINCFIPNEFILDFKSKESNFLIYTNSEEVISDFRWISERGSFV